MSTARQPKGIPVGGQFAASAKNETALAPLVTDLNAASIGRGGWERGGEWDDMAWVKHQTQDERFEYRTLHGLSGFTDDIDEAVSEVEADGFGSVIDYNGPEGPRVLRFDDRDIARSPEPAGLGDHAVAADDHR